MLVSLDRIFNPGFRHKHLQNTNINAFLFLVSGVILIVIGYIFFYLNYSRLGNFFEVILGGGNRLDRNAALQEQRGNLPFTHFLFSGYLFLFASCLLRYSSRKAILIVIALLSPIIIFYTIDGERTAILKYIIAFFFAWIAFKKRDSVRLNLKFSLVILFGFLALAALGNLRAFVLYSILTQSTEPITERISDLNESEEGIISMFIPGEFAAINFTFNKTVNSYEYEQKPFLLGESYYQGVPYLFPRSIYDAFGGTKKLTISDRFGEEMRLEIGRERKVSFSISPLAESYANFGLYGGIALAFIISIFTLFVYSTYYKSSIPIIVLWGVAQTPIYLFINRASFASSFSTFVWVTFVMAFGYIASLFIYQILKNER